MVYVWWSPLTLGSLGQWSGLKPSWEDSILYLVKGIKVARPSLSLVRYQGSGNETNWSVAIMAFCFLLFFHRYQQMTEREKRDFNLGDRNNDHGAWKPPSHLHPTSSQQQPSKPLPVLAKPVASVLSIWTSRQRSEANSYHLEFAGRRYGERAELYKLLNNSRYVLCTTEERPWTYPSLVVAFVSVKSLHFSF